MQSQCTNTDTDLDGVQDCIDPCPNVASSKIGNLSFESDFTGWTIPQNPSFFSINEDTNNSLHGNKSLYVTAPNASVFENHAIYTDEFILEEGVPYNFKIPVKRVGSADGDAIRWVLVDENGIYRHFNNHYSTTQDWTFISYENFLVDFSFYSSNKFRLRLEFGLSTTDMIVDKIEFYETSQIVDPAYLDMDADGNPDCVPFSSANHPDYDALVTLYNSLSGANWYNNANWLDTTKPLSTWYGITETNGRVTHINLRKNNLNGSIPDLIGTVSNLVFLDLAENNLTGIIPSTLGDITTLEWLDLALNNLTGSIPNQLSALSNLTRIALSHNNLSGPVPDFTSQNLFVFTFDNNNFQFGDFEDEFIHYQNNIAQFYYAPQKFPEIAPDSRVVNLDDDLSFNSSTVSGNNNIYNWYLNGALINAANHPNITGLGMPNITIENVTTGELGSFECYVSNTVVTGLNIYAGNFNIGLSPETSPDYDALVALYNALNGPEWHNQNNWLDNNLPISSWLGLTEKNGRVTGILLNQNNVRGSLPDDIVNLTELEIFWVQNAYLTGNIPANMGNLTKLRQLVLNLTYGLAGNIPPSLVNCTNLEWLYLTRNQLQGDIPDFTVLDNLTWFSITNNNFVFADFEDEYTAYLAKLGDGGFQYYPQNLIGEAKGIAANINETITLNAISGVGSQTTVQWYKTNSQGNSEYIGSGNSINIQIFSEDDYTDYHYLVYSNIITTFALESRRITIGPPPENHPDYNALVEVYNALGGPNWNNPWDIAAPISTWSNWDISFDSSTNRVNNLNLHGNDKKGQLPPEIGHLTALKHLGIESSENITGHIPKEIGNLSELESLYLWYCDFSGEVPAELWSLDKLKVLFIGHQKSGQLTLNNGIPSEISILQDLEFLDLQGIPISGTLPTELYNLPKIDYLVLSNCGLNDELPPGLAYINNLHLAGNNFEGAIPLEYLNAAGKFNLNITNNYFDFNDLEPIVQNNGYTNLNYSPQRTRDTEQNLEFPPGQDITLTIDDTRYNKHKNSKGAGDMYQWFKDDVAIIGANSSAYTITNAQETDSGVYYCQITNSLVPDLVIKRADISIVIDKSLTIDENNHTAFSIYPNPTNNIVNVTRFSIEKATGSLFDINGRKILEQPLTTKHTVLDISSFDSGIYLLQIKTNNKTTTKRIVKH